MATIEQTKPTAKVRSAFPVLLGFMLFQLIARRRTKKNRKSKSGEETLTRDFDETRWMKEERASMQQRDRIRRKAGPTSGLKTDETRHSSANRFAALYRRPRETRVMANGPFSLPPSAKLFKKKKRPSKERASCCPTIRFNQPLKVAFSSKTIVVRTICYYIVALPTIYSRDNQRLVAFQSNELCIASNKLSLYQPPFIIFLSTNFLSITELRLMAADVRIFIISSTGLHFS